MVPSLLFERAEKRQLPRRAYEMTLPDCGSSAARARGFARQVLQTESHRRTTARPTTDVVLAVSELAANAYGHAGGSVRIRMVAADHGLLVEIHDGAKRLARMRRARIDGTGGYGLHIVDTLADGWGCRPTDAGKAVWALFRWRSTTGGDIDP